MLLTHPAVYAVGRNYQILTPVRGESLVWVKIGEEIFYDEANGVLRSRSNIHRVTVPMELLDRAKSYTVCERPLVARKPYFSETAPVEESVYPFHPVPTEGAVRFYHISDAHNQVTEPVAAAAAFGAIDFLVLNGDLPDHSDTPEQFHTILELAGQITHGEIPIVFARGNHDLRGRYAERITDVIPHHHGDTYYTFRLGAIWGVVLDCGEDKPDDHPEYGFTIACHGFRRRQTAFLREIVAHAKEEYQAEGVRTRLVVVHNPFTHQLKPPFDIEADTYRTWASLLREKIHPDLMLCGHLHDLRVEQPGGAFDHLGQPCPLVIGSARFSGGGYAGTGFTLTEASCTLTFTDSEGRTLATHTLLRKGDSHDSNG